MDVLSRSVLHAGAFGFFAYGVLNRLLIITGLHHIINNIAWFLLGDYHGVTGGPEALLRRGPDRRGFHGRVLPGDDVRAAGRLPRDVSLRTPRAAPRRGRSARLDRAHLVSHRRNRAHRVHLHLSRPGTLCRARAAHRSCLHHHAGAVRAPRLRFSAGFFDYLLNCSRAARPLWLLPVGGLYFALYYVLFRLVILRFDLKTPGREPGDATRPASAPAAGAAAWVAALGGAGNLRSVDACTTRLRVVVESQAAVDGDALRQLGARGLVRPSPEALQVVVGTTADQLAGRAALGARHHDSAAAPAPPLRTVTAQTSGAAWRGDGQALLRALGDATMCAAS